MRKQGLHGKRMAQRHIRYNNVRAKKGEQRLNHHPTEWTSSIFFYNISCLSDMTVTKFEKTIPTALKSILS